MLLTGSINMRGRKTWQKMIFRCTCSQTGMTCWTPDWLKAISLKAPVSTSRISCRILRIGVAKWVSCESIYNLTFDDCRSETAYLLSKLRFLNAEPTFTILEGHCS